MENRAIQEAASLQFTDGASCRRWIAALPLTNLQSAQRAITEQLALARHTDMPARELLRAEDVAEMSATRPFGVSR